MRYAANAARAIPLEQGASVIRRVLNDPAHSGLIFDFDGTLAPIVSDPENARCADEVRTALRALTRRFCLVAIVSGRALDDLAGRVGVEGIWLIGSHGAALRRPDGREVRSPINPDLVAAIQALHLDLSGGLEAVRVEPKGSAIAYHYRGHEHNTALVQALRARATASAARSGLVIGEGRCVIEIRVPGIDKGAALRRLIDRAALRAAALAGDDWTDVDMFRAAHAHPTCIGVSIAVRSEEMPPPLRAAADFEAESVQRLTDWIGSLA